MTAEDYLRRVAVALRDLPWRTRYELLTELREHLAELPAETDLAARLGSPEEYAADLRSAAGLERRRGAIAFLRARRPRNVILALVALTVIGLAIGAVAWVQSYQPVELGFGFRYPAGAQEDPAGGSEYVVFRYGRPFHFGVTLRNTGSFTVRVLGVPYPLGVPFSARLVMSRPIQGGFPQSLTPFHPFDLAPGQERALVLEGVYKANCRSWASGGSTSLFEFPVRFSFLWRTSTARLRLFEPLAIVFRKDVSCPLTTPWRAGTASSRSGSAARRA